MSTGEQIIDTSVEDELKTSFLSYSMSVIVSRALPDVRDGLKPVHRRILYSMNEMNLRPDKAYMKCARVVGDCMGKYHPHGDSAIYDALVRLAQDWSMRLPLVDGHGNFGTHADSPAAMRYCIAGQTRIRLADGRSVRLEDLAAEQGLTEAGDAVVELDVLGRDGLPVLADRIFHSGTHPTKRVELTSGHAIRGTHNHPLLCLVNVAGVPVFQWLRLDEIEPGTIVALPRAVRAPAAEPSSEDQQLGLLLGAWVAEGWGSETRAGFNNTDRRFFDDVLAAYDALVGGSRYHYTRNNTASGAECYELDIQKLDHFRRSPLAPLLGSKAADKFIPEAIWRGGADVKRAFLQAVFEGDGGMVYGPRNAAQVCYTTYSRRLADEMQELLLEFGIFATRWDDRVRGGHKLLVNSHAGVRAFAENVGFLYAKQDKLVAYLEALPEDTRRLSGDYVPFVADYVRDSLRGRYGVGNNWVGKNNFDRTARWAAQRETILANIKDDEVKAVITPIMDAGYRYVAVAAVTDEAPANVYSVRVVSDDHAFLAGGFINHNTESRMAKSALPMTGELDEETVDFAPNYDGSLQEPKVLPAAFPNLLVNGSEGIAVGMATKMAPHNLGEVVAACKHVLTHPDATTDDLLQFIPGPDLPTGAIVLNLEGAKEAYRTGKGMFVMRAKSHIEDVTARKKGIVFTELPYQVGPEAVIAAIKKQRDLKKLAGVANVVDLTDRKSGLRLVVECKTGFQPQAVLDELLRTTPLQTNFNIHNLALVGGQPRTLTLAELVSHYVNHRIDVTTRRCQFRRRKAEARAHLLEGYLVALGGIDEVVKVIKASKDTATARDALIKKFKLSEIQANAILEMPLRRLTNLEVEKIRTELAELKAQIAELTRLLNDEAALRELVGSELDTVVKEYGTPRRSQLSDAAPVVAPVNEAAARIPLTECTVTVSATGLISHWTEPFSGARSKHDAVTAALATDTHATIGAVTSTGRVVYVPVMEVPAGGKDRGGPVVEFVDLSKGEQLVGLVTLGEKAPNVAVATRNGVVKVVSGAELPKKSGLELIGLKDGDEVIGVAAVPAGEADLVFVASDAQLLRTPVSGVRPQGRTGGGVAGIKLADGVKVIAFAIVPAGADDTPVVTVAGGGAATSAKTTPVGQFPAKGRATGGVRAHRLARGEDLLVAAGIGVNLTGVAANGTLVPLPAEVGKRDGAGVRTTTAVTSVAVRR